MLLLDVIPDEVNYFKAIIKGSNFKDYLRIVQNIPSAEWDKENYWWTVSIYDYDILKSDCNKAKLNEVASSNELLDLINQFNNWKYEVLKYQDKQDSDIDTDSFAKKSLMPHQKVAVEFSLFRDYFINGSDMGCYSDDTEYLSPEGWKRIDRYDGGMVCQTTKEGISSFVLPLNYIKKPCNKMYNLKNSRGLNQLISGEHRVLWFDNKNNSFINSAKELYDNHQKKIGGCKARFLCAVELNNFSEMDMTDNKLRLQIACMADGYFVGKRCVIRLKYERKIKRLKKLLNKVNLDFKSRIDLNEMSEFTFIPPIFTKNFTKDFWKCSYKQRKIICDEVKYWDVRICKSDGIDYFCQLKSDADFIQYCFVSTGRRTSLNKVKDRGYKCESFVIHVIGNGRTGNYCNIGCNKNNIAIVENYEGFKYCFEVPETFLLMRRNGCVFISGNTGKTLPSLISAILLRKNEINSCLIVCPATLIFNWKNEIQKFLPDNISAIIIEGNQEQRQILYSGNDFFKIVNYEKVGLDYDVFLSELQFDLMIVDELHRCRNIHAKTKKTKRTPYSKAVIEIGKKAKNRIGISGTPLQNRIQDIYSIMEFINPNIFGGWFRFMQRYCIKGYFGEVSGYKNVTEINEKLKLVMFRRTKEQVLKDLPEKLYKDIYVELSQDQTDLYRAMKNKILFNEEGEEIFQNVLAKFVYLREICDSAELVDLQCTSSTKIDALKDVLKEIPETSKIVVFSQWTKMIHIIAKSIKEKSIIFTGEVSVGKKRDELVREFEQSSIRLFLMTSAGGEGLNLQCASYLIFMDLPFNPQTINQIIGRLHRKGQINKVTVIRIIAKDTVEDRTLEILKTKTDLFDSVVDGKTEINKKSMLQEIKGILNNDHI